MKKLLVFLVKTGLSLAILGYLFWHATRGRVNGQSIFSDLVYQPKDWTLLAAAMVVATAAVLITLVRWWYLVRALGMPLRLSGALRLGFLGFLFNLAPMGIVGGDLLKAVLLARENPGNRAGAVASVAFDRIIGLYVLFLVATAAILLTGFWRVPDPKVQGVVQAVFALTAIGSLAMMALMTPGFTEGRLTRALGRLPRVGTILENLVAAVREYRRQPKVLAVATAMTVCVHCLFVASLYLIARGLPGDDLSLATHFVVVPVASSTQAIPLPMGPFEGVLEFLYLHVPEAGVAVVAGQGLVVALAYRLMNLLIAAIGMGYYFSSRRELSEAIREVEHQAESHERPVLLSHADSAA